MADFEGRGHSKMQGADVPQFRNSAQVIAFQQAAIHPYSGENL